MNKHQEQIIENIISLFKSNDNEYDLENAIKQFEKDETERMFFQQQIIRTYGLVQRKYSSNVYHLTEKGISFRGFEEERKEEELEKQGKWYQTQNAKDQFEDYPETKQTAKDSLLYARIAIGLTVLTLLQQWMCNKPH